MRILVATSGAYDPERDAQHSAFAFPWPQGSEIHVLTVAEVTYATMAALDPEAIDTASVEIPDANDARAIANTAALRFRELGFQASGYGVKGSPEAEILAHAGEWKADLIVVGWHDLSRIERFLTGSVSEYVVKKAPCSVLVLKH